MSVNVRERAPLRLHCLVKTPSGHIQRWGDDEPKPENVPSDMQFGDGMPGGFDQFDCRLPRKPEFTYHDLERLSTLTVCGAGGEVAWQGRLERTPRVAGGEFSVAPNAVGWQAHLEDDKTASGVYVDRDLGHWGSISNAVRIALLGAGFEIVSDGSIDPDTTTGAPALKLQWDGTGSAMDGLSEAYYDAGAGNLIGSIYYDYTSTNTLSTYTGILGIASDDLHTVYTATSDLLTGTNSSGTGTLTASPPYRFAFAQMLAAGITPTIGTHLMSIRRIAVFGDHGLTKQGTAPNQGFYASDVIADAISRWAPLLHYTTGSNGSIKPTSFVIPHLEFREPTTVAEIVKAANRFHIRDWAVWEGQNGRPTFYYQDRGDGGREWRARVGPSQLEETGPQVDRVWNGVIVHYRDVDGSTRTVGPTNSGADTESSELTDEGPENPANELGIRKWTKLDMNTTSTPTGATEVGARFLAEARQLDRSGKATLVGHVEDSSGILRPYWQVRAGDTIRFVDSADPSPRRIVKTEKSADNRACTVDLDAPPEGMDALLERLGVVLVELGL